MTFWDEGIVGEIPRTICEKCLDGSVRVSETKTIQGKVVCGKCAPGCQKELEELRDYYRWLNTQQATAP